VTFVVTWAGIPCAVAFDPDGPLPVEYRRDRGVRHSVSTVYFSRSQFRRLDPVFDPKRFNPSDAALPDIETLLRASAPLPTPTLERPPHRGDLVMATLDGPESPVFKVVARSLYFAGARVVNDFDGASLVEVKLVDVRRFWPDFGEFTGSFNVPLAPAVDGSPRWVAQTAKDRGTRPTPLREVFQALLNALPGRLQIVRWPDAYADKIGTPPVRCWAASPYETLDALVEWSRLDLDPGPDWKARWFAPGEGVIGEAAVSDSPDNELAHDPATGEGRWRGSVLSDGNGYMRRPAGDAATDVLVCGARTVYTASIDRLEPVVMRTVTDPGTLQSIQQTIPATPENLDALAAGAFDPKFTDLPPDPANVAVAPQITQTITLPNGVTVTGPGVRFLDGAQPADQAAALPEDDGSPLTFAQEAADTIANGGKLNGRRKRVQDAMRWFKLPLLRESALGFGGAAKLFPDVDPATLDMIGSQLLRLYRLPTKYRGLLPLLDRAERTPLGVRLPPVCEAFSFSSRRVIDDPLRSPLLQAREDKKRHMNEIAETIKGYQAQMERLKIVTLETLRKHELAASQADGQALAAQAQAASESAGRIAFIKSLAPLGGPVIGGIVYALASAQPDAVDAIYVAEATDDQSVKSDQVRASMRRLGDAVVKEVTGVEQVSVDIQRIAEFETSIDALKKTQAELTDELYPTLALEQEVAAFELQLAAERASGNGRQNPATVARRDVALEKLREKAKEVAEADAELRELEALGRVVYFNAPRAVTSFSVVDAKQGIIEVHGPLPVWLGDVGVADPAETYCIPAFVKLTFGTYAAPDPEQREGDPRSETIQAVERALSALPELAGLVGPIVDVVPPSGVYGLRFGYTIRPENEGALGNGLIAQPREVNPDTLAAPFRVADPSIRLLVTVTGQTNIDECKRRADAQAAAVLGVAPDVEAGSLAVVGARPVLCNGRIATVTVSPLVNEHGVPFHLQTRLEFDSRPPTDADALRAREPVDFVFGIEEGQ
jgi:hypothetical protein